MYRGGRGGGKGRGRVRGKVSKPKGLKRTVRCLTDNFRFDVRETLDKFLNSNDEVYKFDVPLDECERAEIHKISRRMGAWSKSEGKGIERRISVFKKKPKKTTHNKEMSKAQKEETIYFRFSEAAKGVIQDLFSQYPPRDSEMTRSNIGESSGRTDEQRAMGDMFCRPEMTKLEVSNKLQLLSSAIENSPNLSKITQGRSKLPIASFKDVITSTLDSHQILLVCGETGCGKTTQVPQFLLDQAWGKGETCKIICTQPRRISAISVAERIASERGEDVGDSVGYKIRLESKGGRHSSLVFCTNGVLLKVLVSESPQGRVGRKKKASAMAIQISDITHIIVDEIHERDRFSDFMLAIIRDILPSNPHLRVVLMSATIDAERFSKYFGGCPIIRVPGFTYQVKEFYLEDVLSIVRSTENNHLTFTEPTEKTTEDFILSEEHKNALDEAIDLALSSNEFDPLIDSISSEGNSKGSSYQHSKTGITPLMVFAAKGRVGEICMLLSSGVDCNIRSIDGKTALEYAEQGNQVEAIEIIKKYTEKTLTSEEEQHSLLSKYMSKVNSELIDFVLIETLLRKICNDSKEGAILIFLPGWDDISRTLERLRANRLFNDYSKFMIISLHSMVPAAEQRKVFSRPPSGCRKIILSTNIAETSVTIDDVVFVLDCGRMKERSYDPLNNLSTFQSDWISKASAKQRAGRAGRCQPGICYHLYSKSRAASLPDFQVPEIQRMPIEEICLQVKLIDPSCKIEDFLQKTLDPPVNMTINNAIDALKEIGALTHDEKLTDLGQKLGSMPVHPRTSKMILLGILLNCLDPALTLACASDYKEPFILPMVPAERTKAQAAKLELASFYGGTSDQLAVVAAFECWRKAKEKGSVFKFCSDYFISSNTMNMISGMRKQLEKELIRMGFLPEDTSSCSVESQNPGILHSILVAGLYPNVGRLDPLGKKSILETVNGNKVSLMHSASNSQRLPLIAFNEITSGDGGQYIKSWSVVGPLPLLLLAKDIIVAPSNNNDENNNDLTISLSGETLMSSPENCLKILVDAWIPLQSTALDVSYIYCLRERFSAAILFKVTYPRKALPGHLHASVHALTRILSSDGIPSILPPHGDTVQENITEVKVQTPDNYLKSLMYISTAATLYQSGHAKQRNYWEQHPIPNEMHQNQNLALQCGPIVTPNNYPNLLMDDSAVPFHQSRNAQMYNHSPCDNSVGALHEIRNAPAYDNSVGALPQSRNAQMHNNSVGALRQSRNSRKRDRIPNKTNQNQNLSLQDGAQQINATKQQEHSTSNKTSQNQNVASQGGATGTTIPVQQRNHVQQGNSRKRQRTPNKMGQNQNVPSQGGATVTAQQTNPRKRPFHRTRNNPAMRGGKVTGPKLKKQRSLPYVI